VAHPVEEYASGLTDLGYTLAPLSSPELRDAILKGGPIKRDPATLGDGNDGDDDEDKERSVAWHTAAQLDAALRERGARRPCEMDDIGPVLLAGELADAIVPGWAQNPFMARMLKQKGALEDKRAASETKLVGVLDKVLALCT
jgi:hypothetical protein